MVMTYLTLERTPIEPSDSTERQRFLIKSIKIAVRKGIEVQVGSEEVADPGADCWFALKIQYQDDRYRLLQPDTIVTNGEEFVRCRRINGKSPLVLNDNCRKRLRQAIANYVRKLLAHEDVHPEHWRQDPADE